VSIATSLWATRGGVARGEDEHGGTDAVDTPGPRVVAVPESPA